MTVARSTFSAMVDSLSRLPVKIDWTSWLSAFGTTISSSTWTADAGLTLDGPTFDSTSAAVFISNGTAETSYVLRNTITTASGLIDSRSVRVNVFDR